MFKRVVVTGLGLVTPLGAGSREDATGVPWRALLDKKSGIVPLSKFDASDLGCRIGGELPMTGEGAFVPDDWVDAKERRRMEDFIVYAMAAAEMAILDSGVPLGTEAEKERTGALIGSGIGGLQGIAETSLLLAEKGPRRVSPFFIPSCLINLASGQVSIRHGLKGPNHAVVTACATGVHAIGDAARLIALGDADAMVAGGSESPICRIGYAGFLAAKALSTGYNDTPEKASRPWDKGRDGFLMGEGAGIVVLEEYERAKARGATIYGEVIGYGLSGDAHHITAPLANGDGGYRAMKMALERAGIAPAEIDYVNAHGTSTQLGDEAELQAVERLFGEAASSLVMSSTKSAIGHLLGAAGAVEVIYSLLAMRDGICPPTLNLEEPSVDTPIDLAPLEPVEKKIDVVLSNSFGFGGTNASILLRRV